MRNRQQGKSGDKNQLTDEHSNATSNGSAQKANGSTSAKLAAGTKRRPPAFELTGDATHYRWTEPVSLLFISPLIVFFVVLTVLPADKAHALMRVLDPRVTGPLEEKSYEDDCGWDSALDKILDPFVLAHFVGWFLMSFIGRDFKFGILLFTMDELLELWWKSSYNNFKECAWDSLLLDMLGTNLTGCYFGALAAKKLGWQMYDWFSISRKDHHRRALWYLVNIILFKTVAFFALFGLKSVMWLPPNHPINQYHMLAYVVALKCASDEAFTNFRLGHRRHFWFVMTWLLAGSGAALCIKGGYHVPIWHNMDQTGQLISGLGYGLSTLSFYLLIL